MTPPDKCPRCQCGIKYKRGESEATYNCGNTFPKMSYMHAICNMVALRRKNDALTKAAKRWKARAKRSEESINNFIAELNGVTS